MVWPAIIAAVGAKVMNNQQVASNEKTNKRNLEEQRRVNAENNAHAERMAKNSILWRVEDAKRSGIHPLYALGSQPFMPSTSVAAVQQPNDYSAAGQDISRAIMSMRTEKERAQTAQQVAVQARANELQLENMSLQNDYLRSRIALNQASQIGPPSPGLSTPSPEAGVVPRANDPVIASTYDNAREAGSHTDYSYARTGSGGIAVMPSQDAQDRMEDTPASWFWTWRNQILPALSGRPPRAPSTREFPLPTGYYWHWNGVEFVPRLFPVADRARVNRRRVPLRAADQW